MLKKIYSGKGDTLITVLIAAGIGALAIAAALSGMRNAFRSAASIESRGSVSEFRDTLKRRFNCRRTFPTNVCPGPNVIDPAPAGPPYIVRLKDDFGNDVFTPETSGPAGFAVSQRHGNEVYVNTECVGGSVRLTFGIPSRPRPSGDAIYGRLDLCQEVLGGVFSNACPAGWVMSGINPETLEPVCQRVDIPCGAGQVLRGMNADLTPNCVAVAQPAAHCPLGSYMVGLRADLGPECRALPPPPPPPAPPADCPGSFVRSYNPSTGATTCGGPGDGAFYGGTFKMISGRGAGDNPAFPATACAPLVPAVQLPFGCRCASPNAITGSCSCPAGFTTNFTATLFSGNPALNLGGSYDCHDTVAGCGEYVGHCMKSIP